MWGPGLGPWNAHTLDTVAWETETRESPGAHRSVIPEYTAGQHKVILSQTRWRVRTNTPGCLSSHFHRHTRAHMCLHLKFWNSSHHVLPYKHLLLVYARWSLHCIVRTSRFKNKNYTQMYFCSLSDIIFRLWMPTFYEVKFCVCAISHYSSIVMEFS